MEKEIGSLDAGKRADVIVVRLDRANAVPLYDVYSQLVYALKASDVRDVMVDGRMVVRDGEALTIDSKQVLSKAAEFGRSVRESLRSK
jgi:5-methylthioadenosine/S-adenosylhomocysteine deaminase